MKLATLFALGLSIVVAVAAVSQLAAQTTTPTTTITPIGRDTTTSTTTTTPSASPTTSTGPVVLNVVEITRTVPAGTAAVTVFTVPASQTLIVTDVVVTNTGETATCGAAITRAAGATVAASTPTTATTTTTATGTTAPTTTTTGTSTVATPGTSGATLAGTITQSDSSITGPLCVAARTTTPLPLTTGIEFGPGQTVQLLNVPEATTTGGTVAAASSIGFHLRGILVAS